MQIRGITVNAAGITADRSLRQNQNIARPEVGRLSAECKVTISREGKKLSRESQAQANGDVRNGQIVQTKRMLLHQGEIREQDKKLRDGFRDELSEIEKKITELNSSYTPLKGKDETIEKQQQLLEAMRKQKQLQTEENQRRAKEAQEMAAQNAQCQQEVDENNRDLLTLLKTMEEAKKAEDERENGGAKTVEAEGGSAGEAGSVSDQIHASAKQFMTASARREQGVQKLFAGLEESGYEFIDIANSITKSVLDQSAELRKALDDENFSDEELAGMMQSFRMELPTSYMDVFQYRGWGLQNLQDLRDAKIQHIADDPLKGLQETKRSMEMSAVDAALGEARQGVLDETSAKIADEVERLIDERNDVERIYREKEEEKDPEEEQNVQVQEQS